MVIVGVGAASPGSGRTSRDSPCVPVRVLASCKKVAVESFWHAPPPIHKCVCVCVLSDGELCFGLPDPVTGMVSHLGSSRPHPGQMPRDGARERWWAEQGRVDSAGPPSDHRHPLPVKL